MCVSGMGDRTPVWKMTSFYRVNQVIPSNYDGSFACSDPMLTKLWWIGAYTTRVTFVSQRGTSYLGSILMNRGDRIAFLGDAHVAQATALTAFGPDTHALLRQSLNYTKSIGNDIEPYWVMWVLSVFDFYDATADRTTVQELIPWIELRLARARELYSQARQLNASLRWSRDDPRLGFGFEFPDIPRAQRAYRALVIAAVTGYSRVLAFLGNHTGSSYWSRVAESYVAELRAEYHWWEQFGMHATADAISAGFVNSTEAKGCLDSWFSDPLQLASLSPFESYFVLKALTVLNATEQSVYLMRRQWGGMLDAGATTTWERHDPQSSDSQAVRGNAEDDPPINAMNDRTSMAHPWSSGATTWLTKQGLGVTPTQPGYRTFDIVPRYVASGSVSWVCGHVPTPHGRISFALDVKAEMATLRIPDGTKGRIALPLRHGLTHLAVFRRTDQSSLWDRNDGLQEHVRAGCGMTWGRHPRVLVMTWRNSSRNDVSSLSLTGLDESFLYLSTFEPGTFDICFKYEPLSRAWGSKPSSTKWNANQSFLYPVKILGTDNLTSGSWQGVYGSLGYHLFNASATQEDESHLPASVQVWAPGKGQEDSAGGAPVPGRGRAACTPDGPFNNGNVGRFGSCAFVWEKRTTDRRSAGWSLHGAAAGISATGWKGSFHFDVKLQPSVKPMKISLYFVDFMRWSARMMVKATDLDSENTVARALLVQNFSQGVYFTYETNISLRFRVFQVHSDQGDRAGWAPPPVISAVFFD